MAKACAVFRAVDMTMMAPDRWGGHRVVLTAPGVATAEVGTTVDEFEELR